MEHAIQPYKYLKIVNIPGVSNVNQLRDWAGKLTCMEKLMHKY